MLIQSRSSQRKFLFQQLLLTISYTGGFQYSFHIAIQTEHSSTYCIIWRCTIMLYYKLQHYLVDQPNHPVIRPEGKRRGGVDCLG